MSVTHLIKEYTEKIGHAGNSGQYAEGRKLRQEFTEQLEKLSGSESEIANELQRIANDPCRKDVYFWIQAAYEHPSLDYMGSLCAILESEQVECAPYESVVEVLHKLADPRSIPSLQKALTYELSYDPTQELTAKILWALAQIGTPEALVVVKTCLRSPSEKIRELAELLLEDEEEEE